MLDTNQYAETPTNRGKSITFLAEVITIRSVNLVKILSN